MSLLEVRDVSKVFPTPGSGAGVGVTAVSGVSLHLERGEVLGIVGESGSGKSTLARIIVGLERPTSGTVLIDGQDIPSMKPSRLRRVRRRVQIIFQDPNAALDPRMTVGQIIKEAWMVHRDVVAPDRRDGRLLEVLDLVGLRPEHAGRYPHQLSGGQRQRVAIARALALEPSLLICDEAVSALDVSIQAQILNLLADIRDELGLAMLFVSHDLAVVRQVSDRIAVMYFGQIVETGAEAELCDAPHHPYTQALLSAVQASNEHVRLTRIVLTGDAPDPTHPPAGCRFQGRCWKAQAICADEPPPLAELGNGHTAACFFGEPPEYFSAVSDHAMDRPT